MRIDYKKEVDSGFDRKLIVEKTILELLKNGISPKIIAKDSNFNIRHREMLSNLEKGFYLKSEELEEYTGNSFETLSDSYSEVVHDIQELYPMTTEEEKELFIKRDSLVKEIEKQKQKEIKLLDKTERKITHELASLITKYPFIDNLNELFDEMEEYIEENGTINYQKIDELFKKHNMDKQSFAKKEQIYNKYKQLKAKNAKIILEKEEIKMDRLATDEMERLIIEKDIIEEEIIQRNTKLVNGFIRQRFKDLLVEQKDLRAICLFGLSNAMRDFDVKKGNKFSTLAWKYMDSEVKRQFKSLTGYSWDDYWKRKKIKKLLEITTDLLGYETTVEDLCELGFLDMSVKKASSYNSMIKVVHNTYIYDELNAIENPFDYDKNEETEEYEDIHDFEDSDDYDEEAYEEMEEELEEYDYPTSFEEYAEIDDYEDRRYAQSYSTEEDPERYASLSLLQEELKNILDTLTPREEKVIRLRFGLDDGKARTLEEVGRVFNVTRERVRQIEAKALRKLRHPLRSKNLKELIDDEAGFLTTKTL